MLEKNYYVRDDVINNFSRRSEKFLVSGRITPATFKCAQEILIFLNFIFSFFFSFFLFLGGGEKIKMEKGKKGRRKKRGRGERGCGVCVGGGCGGCGGGTDSAANLSDKP